MTMPVSHLLFDRWLNRLPQSRRWTIALIGVALSIPMLAAIYVDGVVERVLADGYWRFVLESLVLTVYVLAEVRVWIIYICLTTITLLLFFLNTRRTHGLMSHAKAKALARTEHHMEMAFQRLDALAEQGENIEPVAIQINAWAIYKQEIKLPRTWPHNTEMLRTLFLSTLTPVFIGLARLIAILIAQGSLFRLSFLGQ